MSFVFERLYSLYCGVDETASTSQKFLIIDTIQCLCITDPTRLSFQKNQIENLIFEPLAVFGLAVVAPQPLVVAQAQLPGRHRYQ